MAETTKTITIKVNGEDAVVDLRELKNALKETGEAGKKTSTDISNVAQQASSLFQQFKAGELGIKGLIQGVIGLGKALLTTFITNPVLLAITAIVGAVTALYNLFKDFAPIVDKVEQAFAKISAVWGVIKDGLIGLISGNKTLAETFSGLGKRMSEAAAEGERLKAVEQDLEDQAITLATQNKQLETQMKEYLLQAKNRSLTEKERLELLKKADDINEQIFNNNKNRAIEEEKLAFDKLLLSKNISKEEIEALKKIGTAESERIKDKYNLKDEEWKIWNASLQKLESVEQESQAIRENTANKAAALLEKQKADREKAEADRIADEKQKHEDTIKRINDEWAVKKAAMDEEEAYKKKMADDEAAFAAQIDEEQKKEDEEQSRRIAQDIADTQASLEASKSAMEERMQQEKDLAELKKQAVQQAFDDALSLSNTLAQIEINNQNKKLKNGEITQEQYDKKVAEIERKAAIRAKALAVSFAIINTAGAIMAALNTPLAGPGLAIAAAVTGAAQIAAILATPVDGKSSGSAAPSAPTSEASGGVNAPQASFTFVNPETEVKPARAYVVSTDVSNNQQLERQIISNGTY